MVKKQLLGFLSIVIIGCIAIVWIFLKSDAIAMLNPKGLIAIKEKELIIVSLLLMLIVVIPVFILTFFIAWKYRADNPNAPYDPEWNHSFTAECIWWGLPFVIIVILSIITWKSSHALDPYRPIEHTNAPLTIQVVALQWKWLFIYPEQGIATVNFAKIPEKTPISFNLSANAPMNSFWLPQLGGQIYAMPGMKSELHLIADEPGRYFGSSANISGKGFAGMHFIVEAASSEDFEKWIEFVKNSPDALNREKYADLAKPSEYVPPTFYTLKDKSLFDWIVMKPNTI